MKRGLVFSHTFIEELNAAQRSDKLVFSDVGHMAHERLELTFPSTQILVLDHCDKNFVYNWLRPPVFPKLKSLILASHPCEPCVVRGVNRHFPHLTQVFILDFYWQYFVRWDIAGMKRGVHHKMTDEEYATMLKGFD